MATWSFPLKQRNKHLFFLVYFFLITKWQQSTKHSAQHLGYKSMQDRCSLLDAEDRAGSDLQSVRAAVARGDKMLEKPSLEKVWWLGKLQGGSDLYLKAEGCLGVSLVNWGVPGRGKRSRGKRELGDFWKLKKNGWSLERK